VRRSHRQPLGLGSVVFFAVAAATALVGSLTLRTVSTVSTAATASSPTGGWTVYHGDPLGDGVSTATGPIDTSSPAWTSPGLDGQLYGQPLAFSGRVYVATEDDTVVALDGSTGMIVWSTHLASPVPASALPCGDIQPQVGITGTPVIDPSRDEIFAVADELIRGAPAHVIVGLSTVTGKVELTKDVDPAGADTAALLQRTGLTLDDGNVVFGYGGNYGDCSSYHGWVVAVPEAGGSALDFEVDSGAGEHQGAIWMGGAAPVVDAAGNVWVSAGNGSVTSSDRPYDDSDSVLELSPSLHLVQFFAPTTWASDNATDLDFSTSPILLGDGQVVIAGKSQIAYLLDGAHLGGVGGQQALLRAVCGNDIDGGDAAVGTTVYLPCLNGPIAVAVGAAPPTLAVRWRASVGGGPPVVAGGTVWTIGQDGVLYGLDPATGAVQQKVTIGTPANHFPTPGIGPGLLLAPAANQVVAFSYGLPVTSTTAPSSPTRPGASAIPHTTSAAASGGLSPAALAGIAVAALVILGGLLWGYRRRGRQNTPVT
jgi:outer membrane protein assembly factor BamB